MMTATPTQPTTKTAPAPRACWWEIHPTTLPDGRRLGFVGIRVGKVVDYYRALLAEADNMIERWELSKEQRDGTFAEAYTLRLPVSGHSTPVCSCPGWKFGGKCRHTGALAALRSA